VDKPLSVEKLTYVPIANRALGHLGEDDRIDAPDEASRPARAVKRAWEATRQFVLAQAHWSFALRTVALTQRVPQDEWPIALGRNAFPLPADLVELVEIVQPDCLVDDDDAYSIERGPNGQEILADDPGPIVVRYVRDGLDISDPTSWPPAFVAAFTYRLAWEISDALGADKGRKDRALNAYDRELRLARRANARTKPRQRNREGDWVKSRQRGFDRAPGTY
jgi:hypothetical protein